MNATPELIVRLGAVEVRSHDPLAVRTAWRLIASAVTDEEYSALELVPQASA